MALEESKRDLHKISLLDFTHICPSTCLPACLSASARIFQRFTCSTVIVLREWVPGKENRKSRLFAITHLLFFLFFLFFPWPSPRRRTTLALFQPREKAQKSSRCPPPMAPAKANRPTPSGSSGNQNCPFFLSWKRPVCATYLLVQ
ncbi:hypothetical protein P167DRAFT_350713 [Morchella conica CCBAS932]|uniref:Uncharacterized protein n=1 Tax=Morchella conica CCBAS932 TaxID=1392247 RepID=A0A3N4L310_9PEZI|nr:hypothetical protein P167DRAFT_350713 [Morchella conica CCBAS932]